MGKDDKKDREMVDEEMNALENAPENKDKQDDGIKIIGGGNPNLSPDAGKPLI